MADENNALTSAPEVTAPPTETIETVEPVTTGAAPQADVATPESEVVRRKAETRERIEELNAQKKAAVEYAEFWKTRYEESQKAAPVAAPVQETPDPEPDADQFDDPKEYAQAYGKWLRTESAKETKRAVQEAQTAAKAEAQREFASAKEAERLKSLNDQFGLKQQQFAEKTPGYWDAVRNPALSFFNGDFLEAVKADEIGPQLAYHIANTPALVAKLASQSVPQRLATLGRIAADLSRPAPPPKVTAAPAPPSPIGGGQGGEVDPSKLSVDDWMAHRTKEIQARRLNR